MYQGSTYSLSPYRIPKCNDLIVLRLKLDIHIGTYNINNKVLNVRPTPYHLRLCILLFWKGLVRCKANNWIRNFLLRISQMLCCSSIISETIFHEFLSLFLSILTFIEDDNRTLIKDADIICSLLKVVHLFISNVT